MGSLQILNAIKGKLKALESEHNGHMFVEAKIERPSNNALD